MNYIPRYVIYYCLLSFAIVAIVFLAGWFWFGWGAIAANRDLLESLPVPPGAEQIQFSPHPYESDESFLTPPDGWASRTTYSAPPGATRESIVDFYIAHLSPDWQSCIEMGRIVANSGKESIEMGNALFSREDAYVSIDTNNMNVPYGMKTFDVYVELGNRLQAVCDHEWRR